MDIYCELMCIKENKLWLVASYFNILISVDLYDREEKKYRIPTKECLNSFYIDMLEYKNYIIIIPGTASNIIFFDVIEENFLVFPYIGQRNEQLWKFCNGIIYNEKLIALPQFANVIEIVNLSSMRLEENCFIGDMLNSIDIRFLRRAMVSDNNLLYATPDAQCGLIKIDLEKRECCLILEDIVDSFSEFDVRDSYIVVYNPTQGQIYLINKQYNRILKKFDSSYKKKGFIYLLNNGKICLDYWDIPMVEIIDIYSCASKQLNISLTGKKFISNYGTWCNWRKDRVIWFDNCSGKIRVYEDLFDDEIYSNNISIETEYIINNINKSEYWNPIEYEGERIGLDTFCKYL